MIVNSFKVLSCQKEINKNIFFSAFKGFSQKQKTATKNLAPKIIKAYLSGQKKGFNGRSIIYNINVTLRTWQVYLCL